MDKDKANVKNILKSAWEAQKQLEADIEQLQRLNDMTLRITPLYSFAPGGANAGTSKQDAIAEIVLLQNEIKEDIKRLRLQRQKVYKLIHQLDDRNMRILLNQRYMQYKKWEEIAADLHYSWQWVHKMHSRALNKLKKLID